MHHLRYRVKTVLTSSGERLPVLLNSAGIPVWEATLFSLTELRARNRASSTIENSLRALSVFHLFLDLRKIDLINRIANGLTLQMDEIEDLVKICKQPIEAIPSSYDVPELTEHRVLNQSLESQRLRPRFSGTKEIIPAFAATRLRSIRDYVQWMVTDRLSRVGTDSGFHESLKFAGRTVVDAINARLPSTDGRGVLLGREGLDPMAVSEMLRVIAVLSPENPWRDEHSRYRNELVILWLHYLGLRRGELLGVRVSDIDFRKGTVVVARRADDPSDPRTRQPNVKTKAREIPLSPELQDKTSVYIMKFRATLPKARKHPFLLVASDSGAPLSISSFAKIFNVLRAKCPALPRNLFAHLLRHTWNDRFSEEMDRRNVAEETEKKTRSYLMGWSETSGTAATYTRRHVRKKAQEASLSLQAQMFKGHKK